MFGTALSLHHFAPALFSDSNSLFDKKLVRCPASRINTRSENLVDIKGRYIHRYAFMASIHRHPRNKSHSGIARSTARTAGASSKPPKNVIARRR
jgi:hypothetical protein